MARMYSRPCCPPGTSPQTEVRRAGPVTYCQPPAVPHRPCCAACVPPIGETEQALERLGSGAALGVLLVGGVLVLLALSGS